MDQFEECERAEDCQDALSRFLTNNAYMIDAPNNQGRLVKNLSIDEDDFGLTHCSKCVVESRRPGIYLTIFRNWCLN